MYAYDIMNNTNTIKEEADLCSPKEAENAANAYANGMPKHKLKIRKLLMVAFHPTTPEGEVLTSFAQARKLMQKDNISLLDIMRADWGGGPLVAAISKVGHMEMTAGKYMGRNLAWIIQEDPTYIVQTARNGWREGPLLEAIKFMHNAWMTELVCRYAGSWDDPTVRDWDSDEPAAAKV